MGEKDITEKILEDHNDVFADIINGLIFAGEQRILPESLENTAVHSQYKADDEKVHELERDVAKYWKDQDVQLAICGIENQSSVEKYMPFRIIGYDGTAYRSQLQDKRKEILPVILIGRNNPNGGLWFLYALFIISIFGILFDTVNRAILTGVMLVLYVLNAAVFKQSGYIIGFFFSYAWIYFMGGVARRYFYANLKKLQLVMSAKGTAITVVASAGYMVLAFVRIYSVQSLILTTAVTIIGVFWLFIIAMQIEHYHYGEKLWMLLGDYGMDIYMIGYYVQQAIFVVCGKILGLDYLIYAWLMLILGLIAPILLSKYIVRKSKMLSILILGR